LLVRTHAAAAMWIWAHSLLIGRHSLVRSHRPRTHLWVGSHALLIGSPHLRTSWHVAVLAWSAHVWSILSLTVALLLVATISMLLLHPGPHPRLLLLHALRMPISTLLSLVTTRSHGSAVSLLLLLVRAHALVGRVPSSLLLWRVAALLLGVAPASWVHALLVVASLLRWVHSLLLLLLLLGVRTLLLLGRVSTLRSWASHGAAGWTLHVRRRSHASAAAAHPLLLHVLLVHAVPHHGLRVGSRAGGRRAFHPRSLTTGAHHPRRKRQTFSCD
jgi:hypothetical protein